MAAPKPHIHCIMQVHGSCAARDGAGVLLIGPSGSGKSDLLLRLLDRGYMLVADDRVDIVDGVACAPSALAGLLEVRGLGIFRLPHVACARIALAVDLGSTPERLPLPGWYSPGVPLIALDATATSAPQRLTLALDCALGRAHQVVGAFAT